MSLRKASVGRGSETRKIKNCSADGFGKSCRFWENFFLASEAECIPLSNKPAGNFTLSHFQTNHKLQAILLGFYVIEQNNLAYNEVEEELHMGL